MASHKHGLGVSITAKRGLHVFFAKKSSMRNMCIGAKLRGQKGGGQPGVRGRFISAAKSC